MKTKLIIVMSLMLAFIALGCRSISTATPDEVDPEAIEVSVRSQILTEYPDETFDLGVDVDRDGVVTLTGDVDSETQRRRIAELAARVAGVTKVVNGLHVE